MATHAGTATSGLMLKSTLSLSFVATNSIVTASVEPAGVGEPRLPQGT